MSDYCIKKKKNFDFYMKMNEKFTFFISKFFIKKWQILFYKKFYKEHFVLNYS